MKRLLLVLFATASTALAAPLFTEDVVKDSKTYVGQTITVYGVVESVTKSARTDGTTHEVMLKGGVMVPINEANYRKLPQAGENSVAEGVASRGMGFAKIEIKGTVRKINALPRKPAPAN